MRRGASKDLVALLALVAAASYGTWLAARSTLGIGARWSDGARSLGDLAGEPVRYAVWDAPEPLAGEELAGASRPALSPDGRLLVWSAGERGLNADLWVAERDPLDPRGGWRDARPLAAVNGPRDELAPAFGADALWFASDRAGGGDLDLWRVPYDADAPLGFGAPEPVAGGVNGPYDETDPAPLPGGALVFVSDRPRGGRRDHDLYLAAAPGGEPGSGGRREVTPLEPLNTPFEEREPAATPEGGALVFASDRAGTRGGFDLWRSFRGDEGWLPPAPLEGLNTAASERGPLPSADGFTLLYGSSAEDGATGLWRARSRELFRLPAPAVGWRELLVLAALALLALVAWLAKRWGALEVIYKCFLVSLVAHLVLLWLLRDVVPESEPVALREAGGAFRVRLASSSDGGAASRARGGALEARRESDAPAGPERLARATAPGPAPVLAPSPTASPAASATRAHEAPPAAAPPRRALERATIPEPGRRRGVAAELEDREAPLGRLDAAAPALALGDARGRAATPTRTGAAAGSPRRAALGAAAEPRVAERLPGAPALARAAPPRSGAAAAGAPGPRRLARDAGPAGLLLARSGPGLAAPGAPRRTGSERPAPELALPPPAATGGPPAELVRGDEAAPRRAPAGSLADPAPAAGAAAPGPARLAHAEPVRVAAPEGPARSDLVRPRRAPGAVLDGRALRDRPEAAPEVAAAGPAPPRFDPLAELAPRGAAAPSAPVSRGPTGPTALAAPRSLADLARPAPLAPAPRTVAVPPPAPAAAREEVPRRLERTPYRNRFGELRMRALDEHGGGRETERAVAAGLAYLASIQGPSGAWGSARDRHEKYGDVRVGKTGLALLAFLGAGHTPGSGTEHADVARAAVDFLLGRLDERSGHFGDSSAYGHGIATYALAECYALTRESRLARPLERAVAHVLANQSRRRDERFRGGWGYYFADGRVWNDDPWPRVSVTAWQVMALESARLGGLEVADEAFDEARGFLLRAWDERRGAFRYCHDPSRLRSGYPLLPASTPAALFALSLVGVDGAGPELAEARRFVLERAPRAYRYDGDDAFVFQARGNLYFWYYGTLATFRVGGAEWRRWNEAMKETLLPAQEADGSWEPISVYCGYAGDDDGDRSYATAMCVLSLEVYYRYFTPLLEVR